MKISMNCKLWGFVVGALSLASVTGCAADVDGEYAGTTATAGEGVTLTGSATGDGTQAYRWQVGDSPRLMSKSADTFCFLTEFEGVSRTAADQVYIVDNTVNWILFGETASGTSTLTHKVAARCINKTNTTKKIWHWPQTNPDGSPDFRPNALRSSSSNVCVLTGFGGGFSSTTDYVRTAIGSDGLWYLEGKTSTGNVHADATCIPLPPFTQDIGPLTEGLSTMAMLPLTYYNPNPIGAAACGLTQIGGALGAGFPTVLDAKIVLNETRIEGVPSSPGWKWLLSVKSSGRKTSADTRCFQ
jgi:hypothetical protein